MSRKKVIVAMSGGVDSSVAALILKQQGYEVIGVTMNLFSLPKEYCKDENLRSCCGWGAIEDANRVASLLGIPHYVVDLKADFEKHVIADFCDEYACGRTPNPCIRCNEFVKFITLLERADKLDADYLATGHHARVMYDPRSGKYFLNKGRDRMKDQSYFLYVLTQKQLSRILMPIGHFTKDQVRKKAKKSGLPAAKRPESQEICFIPDNDYVRFLKSRIPEAFRSGPIVDSTNRVLGRHNGILYFTVGQRRGIGIAAPKPFYVIDIQRDNDTVVVGTHDELYKNKLVASKVNMIFDTKITEPTEVKAKIRYKHRQAKAVLSFLDSDQAVVEFKKAQRAITPGQAVVFYDGDVVIGGGCIEGGM